MERLIAIEYSNQFHLASRTSRVELFIMEKEQSRSNQASPQVPQLILVIEYDLAEEDGWEDQLNV